MRLVNTDGPTIVAVHAHPDSPQIWTNVAALLDGARVVHTDPAGLSAALTGDRPVHVVAHGPAVAAVWDALTRPGAAVASVTLSPPVHRRRRRRRPFGPAQRVDVPVQLIVSSDRAAGRRDDLPATLPRLWRREVATGQPAPDTHPELYARAVRQFVEHLDGAPAARELRRAEMRRERRPFGDTLVSVTGAGSGIGRETALAFARDGAELVISDVDGDGLAETARQLADVGATAHRYVVDVADAAAVESFAEEVCGEHGVPDIVINNAGVGHAGYFLDTPADEFDRVLDINFGGVVNGCRSFGRRLVERGTGGHIVNIASMASYTPVNMMNAYCTSKAAVFMFSDCLRAELDSAGVGVTTICPGVIGTNIVDTTRFSLPESRNADAEKLRARARRGFSLRRYGPDKVARAIVSAVSKKKAVRPVTPEAHVVYAIAHAAPAAMRSGARGGKFV
ncbi:SDR family oxidoreductase [Mycolicibacterium obuense]|uniref:SDR family oxidoreductase n=1 Tax=Mycolicibacterium obuense TaxID=1807 RepID=A0A4R5X7Q1_9MYCO|nr:SDR family oxidoreductase [Mycolicibacterium obuense]TDL08376.1 SDR family oxidoreductase [Mycolicibacterium obuense]